MQYKVSIAHFDSNINTKYNFYKCREHIKAVFKECIMHNAECIMSEDTVCLGL
jgi:hypothetical protein